MQVCCNQPHFLPLGPEELFIQSAGMFLRGHVVMPALDLSIILFSVSFYIHPSVYTNEITYNLDTEETADIQ